MGALDRLDGFCGREQQFWRRESYCLYLRDDLNNPDATCHDEVDLSLCFEDTAILYTICAVFWLLAGLKFLFSSSIKPQIPYSRLHAAKLILIAVPVVTALCDLAYTLDQGRHREVAYYLYLSPIVLMVTMVIVTLVVHQERKAGMRSSGLMLIFWMGLSIYSSFKFRSLILLSKDQGEVEDKFRFTTFILQYATYLVQFVLAMFPEPRSHLAHQEDERKPCPEGDATFLSRITWWWLTGLIWLGWRRSLEYTDLTDLNPEDKSRVVAPQFQRNWDREIEKAGITFGRVHVEEEEYQPVEAKVSMEGVRVVNPPRRRQGEPSLVWALAKSFSGTFLMAAVFKLGQDLLSFASPQILKLMIQFTEDSSEPDWKGYFYAVLLFLVAVVQSLFLHQYFHRCYVVGMRIRTAVIAAVYRKALCLSNQARRTSTVGEIVNLMSVDAQRFMDLMTYFHMIWSAPLQIVLALVFLYFTMGFSIFAGFAVMLLLLPVNAYIAAKSRGYQVRLMVKKDSRIKLVNEVLNGIKVIKLYAWEIPFQQQIMGIRNSELDVLKKSTYLMAASSFTWTCAPFLVSLATFMTYALVNQHSTDPNDRLTADKAFVALSLFNILRFPLSMLPLLITSLVQASVSVKRLSTFLKNDELDPTTVNWRPESAMVHEDSVSVIGGKFSWEAGSPERPTLSDLNLHIKPGQLVAVVGQVGTGKSSLISALLGEMEKLAGSVTLRGGVAYVPQQAWIQNATLKSNILFGKPMRGVVYGQTIQGCALEPDLEILPGGDMTEIGEKGINLSGGQKQRVSLARAVYQDADIYLLDDPLSAVDSHVGKHIFEKVIGPEGMLKGKVRLLVTHGTGFLPQCDQIVVMDGGRITEVGTYSQLIDADGAFAEFLRTYANVEENEEGDPTMSEYSEFDDEAMEVFSEDASALTTPGLSDEAESYARKQARKRHLERQKSKESFSEKLQLKRHSSRSDLKRQLSKQKSITDEKEKSPEHATERSALITEEKVETGGVKFSVFIAYARACTYYMSFLVILFYVLMNGASVASNFWLADWSNAEGSLNITRQGNITFNPTTACDDSDGPNTYVFEWLCFMCGCYLGIYAGLGALQAIFVLFAAFALALAGVFASKVLHNNMLKNILHSPMSFFDTTPLGRILNRFSKDVYTIDEVIPRSLRSFISTFLSVISTIIVIVIATPIFAIVIIPLGIFYMLVQRFYVATSRQLKRLESTTRSPIYSQFQETVLGAASIRAYRQQERFIEENERRVDYNQIAYYPSICSNRWLAIRLEFVGNLIILFAALFAVVQRNYSDQLNLSVSPGLVGLSITYALQVTQALNWMVRMTSELETNIVAVERTKEYSETPTEAPAIIDSRRPPHDWPQEGHVKFDRYSTRYRAGLDLVLRDIAIDIPGGTKVGIVGRTGAGKSSLTLALFRIIEPSGGAIMVDNLSIVELGLRDLRSKITIIPQDPVLFSGTLRVNLDPFNYYTDGDVWRSLESAHLSSFVSSLPEKLEHPIAEGGENLSVGQRQLVCLARALLRKTKILVLDEATAAVDLETDDLIQKTIRAEFGDCTVLTIAHRLKTIMDYDYVMVLDAGRIVEYDPPGELLSGKKTVFYTLAKDAGLVA